MNQDLLHIKLAAFLSKEMDEKNLTDMEKEINKDKAMQKQIDDYSQLWDTSSKLSQYDKIDVEADWQKVRGRMGLHTRAKRIPLPQYLLRISAILVLAFGLAYVLNLTIKTIPGSEQTDYFKEVADLYTKDLTLPDGSVVTLNAGSSIFYNNNFGQGNRDIILEGEAFFDVEPNKDLPFKVFVSNSTIEVLGTSFNVKAEKFGIQLCVVSGKVAFFETSNKNNRIELVKDEMVKYNTRKKEFDDKIDLNPNTIAWKTGKLEFRNTPVEEVLYTLAQYFDKKLVMDKNLNFQDPLFSGEYSTESLEVILEDLNITTQQQFEYTINDKELVFSVKN